MYRVIDNKTGSVLAICFTEDMARLITSNLPDEPLDENCKDEEWFSRYAWEDCFQHPTEMIGDTIKQLGDQIQFRFYKNG